MIMPRNNPNWTKEQCVENQKKSTLARKSNQIRISQVQVEMEAVGLNIGVELSLIASGEKKATKIQMEAMKLLIPYARTKPIPKDESGDAVTDNTIKIIVDLEGK